MIRLAIAASSDQVDIALNSFLYLAAAVKVVDVAVDDSLQLTSLWMVGTGATALVAAVAF